MTAVGSNGVSTRLWASYAAGSVAGTRYVGGLMGWNISPGAGRASYARGAVSRTTDVDELERRAGDDQLLGHGDQRADDQRRGTGQTTSGLRRPWGHRARQSHPAHVCWPAKQLFRHPSRRR